MIKRLFAVHELAEPCPYFPIIKQMLQESLAAKIFLHVFQRKFVLGLLSFTGDRVNNSADRADIYSTPSVPIVWEPDKSNIIIRFVSRYKKSNFQESARKARLTAIIVDLTTIPILCF